MSGWERVYVGLNRVSSTRAFAESIVKNKTGYYDTAEEEIKSWQWQLDMLRDAHVFEFDKDLALMLRLTDNSMHDVKLPFPVVFLDCEFTLSTGEVINTYVGILLFESPGVAYTNIQLVTPRPTFIRAIAYMVGPMNTVVDVTYPIGVDLGEFFKGLKVRFSRYGRAEYKALQNLTLNFLDILETSDVFIVPIRRGRKNIERRIREGKIPLPPSEKVVVRPSIRRYIAKLKTGGHFTYSHRFWVRGHWKHWRHERYAASGRLGTKTWVPPYIKGEGLLVKKKYEVR